MDVRDELDFDEWQFLLWKTGRTYTRPWVGAVNSLREKGYLTEGDVMSSELTQKARAAMLAAAQEQEGE